MSSSTFTPSPTALYRLSAISLTLCGPVGLLGHLVLHPHGGHGAEKAADAAAQLNVMWVPAHSVILLSYLLALLGLPALYTWLSPRLGWLGFAGAVLAFIHMTFGVGNMSYEISAVPRLAGDPLLRPDLALGQPLANLTGGFGPVGWALLLGTKVGIALFGVAILRSSYAVARARWAGLLLVIGGPLSLIISGVGLAGVDLALSWLGVALWIEHRQTTVPVMQPDAVQPAV